VAAGHKKKGELLDGFLREREIQPEVRERERKYRKKERKKERKIFFI
jgi:hypothetical protein